LASQVAKYIKEILDEAFEVPHEFLDELGFCMVHEEVDGEQESSANNHESVYIIRQKCQNRASSKIK
jgi:hypothetical protein